MTDKPTVLVVEDDVQWQKLLKETLEDEGYNVIALDDYRQGRQALNYHHFDLVILDLELDTSAPTLDGERLLRRLRQHHAETPCIIVSGQGDVNIVRNAFKQYHVADFIPKEQFDILNFVKAVEGTLRSRQPNTTSRDTTDVQNGPKVQAATKTNHTTALSSQLLQVLVERFDQGELRTLCFHLGIDDQLLGGRGKADQARELIIYLAHRHRLAEILQVGQRMRPDIPWGDIA